MDRETFISRLRQAGEWSRTAAIPLVRHELPEQIRFAVRTIEVRPNTARRDGSEILDVAGHPPLA